MTLSLNFFHSLFSVVLLVLKISDFSAFFSENVAVDQIIAILGLLSQLCFQEELGTKSTGVFENTGGTSDTVVTGRWTERQQEGRGTTFTPYYVSLQLF